MSEAKSPSCGLLKVRIWKAALGIYHTEKTAILNQQLRPTKPITDVGAKVLVKKASDG